jgi:signal transduction histidine kinase/CheY-like chemotaxis protein
MPHRNEKRRQLLRLDILATISRALASGTALEPLLETVRHEVGRLFDPARFTVALVQRDAGRDAWLSVPLRVGGQDFGALVIRSEGPERTCGPLDRELFGAVAAQIAASARMAQLHEDALRRVREMETLVAIGQNVSSSLDLKTVLDRAAQDTLALITGGTLGIFLREADGRFKTVAASGFDAGPLMATTVRSGVGILGDILANRASEIVNDATGDPRVIRLAGSPPNEPGEKLMAAPLVLDGEVVGIIAIWRIPAHPPFAEADLRFLEAIGRQVATAVWNAKLYEEAHRRARELETLVVTGQNVSSSLDLEVVLERAAQDTLALITGDTLGIFLRDAEGIFRTVAASGVYAVPLMATTVRHGFGILGDILANGASEIVNDATGDSRAIHVPGSPPDEPGEKLMGVPLAMDGDVIGLLSVWRLPAHPVFEERDLRFLEAIGRQVIVAIRNARLFGEARQAQAEAEQANRAKSAFLASMSHELRTPLHAILGFTQIMRHAPDRSPEDSRCLGKLQRAGEHLLGLINDVLSIAQIESGRLVLNPGIVNFHQMLQDIEEMVRIRAQDKRLSLELVIHPGLPAFVRADEGKLRQVLINLLGNAVKFTAEGSIGLRAYPVDGRIGFEVRDTGAGLTREEQAELFSAFTQTSAGKASREGTGLGLHISQALVGLMGGQIEVESEAGRGSAFRFVLPLEAVEPAGTSVSGECTVLGPVPGQAPLRMLVVDDHRDNRELLKGLLGRWGQEVREAADGAEAVRSWEAWRPQVVWMDLRMQGTDGWEAVDAIRKREALLGLERCLVLAVSASVLDVDRESLLRGGFDEFIRKPFLEAQIAEFLEKRAGIAFQRQEVAPPRSGQESGGVDAAWLLSLPGPWRARFRQCLILGDLPAALALLKDAEGGAEALAIERLVREFRFEELLARLESV